MSVSEEHYSTITENLRRTFKAWRSQKPQADFLRGMAVVEQRIRAGETPEQAVYAVVVSLLSQMATHAPAQAELLRHRWNGSSMGEVANHADRSEADLFKKEKEGFVALAKLLAHDEERLRRQRQVRWLRTLPPAPYNRLVGADAKLSELLPHFQHEDAPWLIALVGMGGIGKTSLSHALVRELVASARFDQVAWVSAQQTVLSLDGTMEIFSDKPALTLPTLIAELGQQLLGKVPDQWRLPLFEKEVDVQEHLLTVPTVVVIDNLETAGDMNRLLPFLQGVRGPTKFILTSRVTPTRDGSIFNYQVPALSFEESLTLIQEEARLRNLPTLLHCDYATATLIYEVTGGNPLALRLVVGQVEMHGLASVLDDLRQSRGASANLYRYLYGWVWQTLPDINKAVLHSLLLLTNENSTAPSIQLLTQFEPEVIRHALQQLVTQNLVILNGTLEERCYTLHSLTRAFLEEMNRTHGTTTVPSPGPS